MMKLIEKFHPCLLAFGVDMSKVENDFSFIDGNESRPFFYWGENPCLYNWLEHLFRLKGGENVLNFHTIRVESEELDKLEKDIKTGDIVLYDGYGDFVGDIMYTAMNRDLDMHFVKDAREEIAKGRAVYVRNWRYETLV